MGRLRRLVTGSDYGQQVMRKGRLGWRHRKGRWQTAL